MRQCPLSLHRKTAKLLNIALILPILKILQKKKVFYQYSTGGHFLFYNFCCIKETVDFLTKKSAKMSLKLPRQIKSALKTSDFVLS